MPPSNPMHPNRREERDSMAAPAQTERIVILDYGSQYTSLIARRIREKGVFAVVLPHDTTAAQIAGTDLKGVILSGGPDSVTAAGAPTVDPAILALPVPVL